MSGLLARRRVRRLAPAELDAIELPISRRHNGGPLLDDQPARAAAPLLIPLPAPVLIFPKTALYYRGLWNGSNDFAGHVLVEDRAGRRKWIDIQALMEGEWDGRVPTVGMLSGTAALWMGSNGVVPGNQTWTSSGTHVVAPYNRLEVAVWGGGGNGGSAHATVTPGSGSGGDASFYEAPLGAVYGGRGNSGFSVSGSSNGTGGGGGTGDGGDTNITGSTGTTGTTVAGNGGASPSSSGVLLGTLTGGATVTGPAATGPGVNGNIPGGGGSGAKLNNADAGGGGGGGFALKLWNTGDSGAPAVSAVIALTVGAGRTASSSTRTGGNGARGEVRAAWD